MDRTRHLNPYLLKKAADMGIKRPDGLPSHELKELAAQLLQADLEDDNDEALENLLLNLLPSELQMIGRYMVSALLYGNSHSFELAGRVLERSILRTAADRNSPIRRVLAPTPRPTKP